MRAALAIDDVIVFDGTKFLSPSSVGIARGRITEVSEAGVRAAAHIDARGRALLPGFVDRHVHLGSFDPAEVLAHGITAARDLGWPLRDALVLAAHSEGPLLHIAGPMLTAPGGYPSHAAWAPRGTAMEIADEDAARAAVRGLAAAGVHVIKIAQEPRQGRTLPPQVVHAICEEAHANERAVTTHCGSLEQLHVALEAGVDEFAHGLWSDERIPDETLGRMAETVTMVTTLHIDPSPARIDNVARLVRLGGEVVYGTDMGNPPAGPRIDVEELQLMMRAGMSIEQTLAAATSVAADGMELFDQGRIEEDAIADLILVGGDPREDLAVLSEPSIVWKGGVQVP